MKAKEFGLSNCVTGSDELMLKAMGMLMEVGAEPKMDFKRRIAEEQREWLRGRSFMGRSSRRPRMWLTGGPANGSDVGTCIRPLKDMCELHRRIP